MVKMIFLLQLTFLTSSILLSLSVEQPLIIVINGTGGKDTTECLLNSSFPCQSLSFVTQNLKQTESVWIEISGESSLNLTVPVEFTNYTNLMITGSGNKTIHCNKSEAGLAFVSVKNLTIFSLTIEKCGALRKSTNVNPHVHNMTESLNVAVYILNCTDVTILCVDILSSNGTGLSFYDTNGVVNITECNFKNNSMLNQTVQPGGGGMYIEFTICTPGIVGPCSGHNGQNTNSSYIIQKCNFTNNAAFAPESEHAYVSPSTVPRVGGGGGLCIGIGSNANKNVFNIQDCHFEGNSASFGAAGMLAEFLSSVQYNNISVYNTDFINNYSTGTNLSSGGGLVVDVMFYAESRVYGLLPSDNSFSCTQCNFTGNRAYYMGGGTGIYTTKDTSTPSSLSDIRFVSCNWRENTSPIGSAVSITPGIWGYTTEGFLPVPQFTDCTFESNNAIKELPSLSTRLKVIREGYGALYINELRVTVSGSLHFIHNTGSAIHLSNSVLDVRGESTVTLLNNTAYYGGAVAMYGSSVIRVDYNTTLNFTGNTAYSRGGAIYVDFMDAMQHIYHNCFIELASKNHKKRDVFFFFSRNNAHHSGSSIYATTFRPCETFCKNNSMYLKDILQCIANFTFNDSKERLVTQPDNFTLITNSSIKIIPGSEYQLPLVAVDENGTNLPGMVYEAAINNLNMSVDPAFDQVSNNTIKILGKIGDNGTLKLHTFYLSLSLNFTLVDCQPGYHFNRSKCECASNELLGLWGCEPVYIKHGYWLGNCFNGSTKLCTTYCPNGFCSYNDMDSTANSHALPNISKELDSHICGPYRTGRACGKCAHNHSVHFHSVKLRCGHEDLCEFGLFFYLLSEIIPVIILFITILFFNISFTSGNVNCFVFFAQILDSLATDGNGILEFRPYVNVIREVYSQLYRPLNLNFFTLEPMSFCLWKGANVFDVFLMKYVTVGFALVLVLLTILLVRCQCAKLKMFQTPNSVLIHGLSAFFVLCYSQSTKISFDILANVCLYSHKLNCEQKIVRLAGYMNYLDGEHIQYAVIAIFVLIFIVIIPPLLLLIYPLVFRLLGFCKLSESKLASALWRVMPIQLLDAFQSSFKDEYRFFAAFYFLYRAMVLGAFAYSETVLKFYSIVQLMLILALAIHAVFQPHKKRKHNVIDTLLFTDLAIINAITLYFYAKKDSVLQSSHDAITFMVLIQAILILLPFVLMIVLGSAKWKQRRKKEKDSEDLPPLRSREYEPLLEH